MIYTLFTFSFLVYLYLNWENFVYYNYEFAYPTQKSGKLKPDVSSDSIKFRMWLYHFIRRKKPDWVIAPKTPKWKIAIVNGLGHFIGIFCCVAFAFCILQFWVDHSVDINKTSTTILQIEQMQAHLKKYVDYFKIGTGVDILIIFLLILLAASFPALERYKLTDKYTRYNKWIKTVSYVLMISTSFTFFGSSFSENEKGKIAKLEGHKLEILESNKLLAKEVQQDVQEKVVNQVLNDPQINLALIKIDQVRQKYHQIKESKTYADFAAMAAKSLLDNLSINKANKYNDFTGYFNDPNRTQELDKKIDGDEVNHYNDFKERNKSWYHEGPISNEQSTTAKDAFEKIKVGEPTQWTKYYDRYSPVIEKTVKAGYGKTGKTIITTFFKSIGVDFPMMDELLDPIINDPLEDYIAKKTDAILRSLHNGNYKAAENEWEAIALEVKMGIAFHTANSYKFNKLKNSLTEDLNASKSLIAIMENEIAEINADATKHLREICENSRWEKIRDKFKYQLEGGEQFGFSSSQLDSYKKVLSDWNYYKESQKLNLYANKVDDLELTFYDFSKDNSMAKACWGFILQQEDWDGGVYYYRVIAPENVRGNPHSFLKYYYNSTGHKDEIDQIYDYKTDRAVGILCPETNSQ